MTKENIEWLAREIETILWSERDTVAWKRATLRELLHKELLSKGGPPPVRSSSIDTIVLDKELDRVLEKIQTIKATYGAMQTWSQDDRKRLADLVNRKREIMTLLGVKE